jgi:tRNA(fMet)-specific endonuclease VapC
LIILDTDIISLLDRQSGQEFEKLARRLLAVPDNERVCTTIISFEEHMRGWLAQIAAARKPKAEIMAYARLQRLLREYQMRDVLPFDERAAAVFASLRRHRLRIGTMDLRIGAVALAHDARLISRNLRDFGQIPRLRVEDWTR